MPLSVVTNVASLNAQRNLNQSGSVLDRSMQRLSSGLRINSAKDDAAGLSIASRFTAQSRGLAQAVRNSNDGISLAQVAEGALNQSQSIIQRVRELAVQSANDTNSDSDRESIDSEAQQLIAELDRIAQTTNFNDHKILDGSFLGATFQVGANARENLTVAVGDARASSLGRHARQTGAAADPTQAFAAADLNINGTAIRASQSDGVSTVNANGSVIAKAAAINDVSAFTKVSAIVGAAVDSGNAAITAGTLDSTNNIEVNGVTISGVSVLADDADGALVQAINAVAAETGVIATKDDANRLVLTAKDGRNIQLVENGTGDTISGLAASVTGGTLTLVSDEGMTVILTANGASASGLAGAAGTESFGVSSANSLAGLDLTTQAGAATAIEIADKALAHVGSSRASLGAIQNRLESTIANLSTAYENIEAARGRIEDTDFAMETAQMTRNQILQQAGASVLAQANQRPQIALSLLQ